MIPDVRSRTIAVVAATAFLLASVAAAQFRRSSDPSLNAHRARPTSFDGQFHYCRAMYRQNLNGDGGTSNDYQGLTKVNEGTLQLDKDAPALTFGGNLEVGDAVGAVSFDDCGLLPSRFQGAGGGSILFGGGM